MTDQELAWAAGFFDGEGYVGLEAKRMSSFGPTTIRLNVSVSNTDVRALKAFRQRFGGYIFRAKPSDSPRHRAVYKYGVQGARAYQMLKVIAPYTMIKREQIELALKFWELPWRGRRGAGRTSEQVATELDLARNVRRLKRQEAV